MVFALLFFVSFIVGVLAYLSTDRWWLGGALCAVLLCAVTLNNVDHPSLQGVAVYFGVPIVFLGSLFGAYIVQLRRAPELEEPSADQEPSVDQKPSDNPRPFNDS